MEKNTNNNPMKELAPNHLEELDFEPDYETESKTVYLVKDGLKKNSREKSNIAVKRRKRSPEDGQKDEEDPHLCK